ncbi:hypothetical protein P3X46_020697 [Hevea brasiliensis]|uniref:DUF632 domain-containing protein n=1 Tax=Hevea brasiliensis TaxID=3981 RepID=A0ABQ9LFY1_HEVBR|nr:protein ALTERED PHOSPHATE STARVATION RESPONSE 1 [Hevea brasiliensis]KAJ9165880.1 hypothetical protein P3X46_020697 [Hevea brasiliensis]
MGCSTSRIDHLPVVSLCHDRCKFLDEALYQSYALADAHVAYMQSLKALGPSLCRFFDQNLGTNNHSNCDSLATRPNPSKSSPSPDHHPSSSNSEPHLDFPSDSEDDEFKDTDFDLLHRIHPNYFDRQTPTPSISDSYSYSDHNKFHHCANNGSLFHSRESPYSVSSPDGGSAWKTPSPPPPSGSTWEFLNVFDTYESYELPIKDKEGIHELKDKLENKISGDSVNLAGQQKPSKTKMTVQSGDVKLYEVHVVHTNVVSEKEKKDSAESKNQSIPEVMRELEALFERASDSGNQVLKILDTGKFRYHRKNSIYQGVPSKMLHALTPSFLVIPSKNTESSSTEKIGSLGLGFDEDLAVISLNLSSTLKKLCMWEKKLYDEVKAEEKLRVMISRTYRQMKNIGMKGEDAKEVDSARTLVRALSTKIKVAIQVIDRTSIAINKLRDEELWPLIGELIQKLLEMWKAMLECHRSQSQAVVETRGLDAILSNGKFSEIHLEAGIQLKIEIQNCNLSFSNWISAQKGYVKALNGWLLKCLPHEPEEMPDETEPFSSGKAGVPPVFALFNQWSHDLGLVSEMEVINSMYGFFMSINQLVERHYIYLQQRLTADKDLEKRIKILEREEKRMQKVMQAQGKKMFLASGDARGTPFLGGAVRQSEMTNRSSLQSNLKQIFVAIEKFSANSVQVYKELHVHVEECSLTRGGKPEDP